MSKCRNTPLEIQRILRQEARFGCALCGCPILENAHIIPYSENPTFNPDDMVALCPTCHTKADVGGYSESYLREIKKNPVNSTKVSEAFLIESQDLIVNLGVSKFINTPRILVGNDFDIISIDRKNDKFLNFNLNLFDISGNWVVVIEENKWTVDTSLVWDLEYRPQHLTIRNAPRKILFDCKIENGEVFVTGNWYYKQFPIKITDTEVLLGENNISLSSSTFKNNPIGISFQI